MTGARRDTAERTAAHRSRSIRDRRREALCLRGQGHVLEPDRRLPAGSPDARQLAVDALKTAVARRGDHVAGCLLIPTAEASFDHANSYVH